MMPVFWWYLLKNYFKVLLLSVISFIMILLVSRLEEIARFAALGAKLSYLALFIYYQIPYVLPIAIPISCLISAILLFQRLSHTHELTALRAGGIGLLRIITPILCAGAFLSIGTFYIASEIATSSHLATRKMAHDLCAVNPLLLLQSSKIARLQHAFVQMDPIRNGESASDLVIALNNQASKRINLCFAKQVDMEAGKLCAKQVSLISSSPSSAFDHLIIENQQSMSASAEQLASLLRKSGWRMANDHLKFSLLRIRLGDLRQRLEAEGKISDQNLRKCQSEFIRRFSIGLASFTFTLMGVALGMEISRNRSKKGIIIALLLTAFSLVAFCVGKEMGHLIWVSTLCYLIPHGLIGITSLWTLNRVNQGIE